MKNIFYILALLVTAGAGYFSFNVQQKFQEEHDWINLKYKDEPDSLVGLNENLKANIESTRKDLKEEEGLLDAAKTLLAERNAEIDVAQSNERKLQRDLSETEAQLEEQDAKLNELNLAVAKVKEIVGEQGVTLEELPQMIGDIRQQKQDLTDQLAELDALVEGAKKNLAKNQDEVVRLKTRKTERDSRIGGNSMEAAITGVNHAWGFVIVGAGSNSGFTPQTTVLVKRDGRVIGRLNPSSIEPNQTIFEIDKDSLMPGVRLRAGDRVILSKPRT